MNEPNPQGATPSFAPAISSHDAAATQPLDATGMSSEPAPFDAAAFESELKSFDPTWTRDNWKENVKSLHGRASQQGRQIRELTDKLKGFDPWEQAMKNEPGFEDHVVNAVRDYYANRQPGYQPMQPNQPALLQRMDPVMQRLDALESDTKIRNTVNDLTLLQGRGFPVTEEMQDEIVQKAVDTNYSFTTEQYYMALYGPKVLELKAQEAARAATAAIQQNNGAYRQPPAANTAPGAAAPVDVTRMSSGDHDAYAVKRIRELFPNGVGKLW